MNFIKRKENLLRVFSTHALWHDDDASFWKKSMRCISLAALLLILIAATGASLGYLVSILIMNMGNVSGRIVE